MKQIPDIPYLEDGREEHRLDIYLPEHENFDTVLWFHGGGLEEGNRKACDMQEYYTRRGCGFVSAEYRLYPGARFPEYLEDAADAAAYIVRHIGDYGGSGRVFITGQSAGAYITMMLCMDRHFLEARGISQDRIAGYISDSAQQCCHYNVLRELGQDTRLERIDLHAPIYYADRVSRLRPLLLLFYEDDIPCRPEENRLLYANLRRLHPEAVVQIDSLPGTHCSRSETPDGEPLVCEKTYRFMESLKK